MKTPFTLATILLSLAGTCLIGISAIRAAAPAAPDDPTIDAATKAKIALFDKGPSKIDVSAYPPGLQKGYKVFAEKCTLCHTLARPINSDFALPDEWSRYVKRMMYKPGSMIAAADAKTIFEFLAYDSSVRKKALFDQKLAAATPADKADAETKIKDIIAAYPAAGAAAATPPAKK
jgi:cytochrome c5